MKVDWDYTEFAAAYQKRPSYSRPAMERMLSLANINAAAHICDVGAGTGHLTIELAKTGCAVAAIEPNDAMRTYGINRLSGFPNVVWFEGTGEATGQDPDCFSLVTFGSSFNVTNRQAALRESHRILKNDGWFACMWNHRELEDPLQAALEEIIKARLPNYQYGTRREDQTSLISSSGLFKQVQIIKEPTVWKQSVAECVEAWRSHATLARQAGKIFPEIIDAIEEKLISHGEPVISIPYVTSIWMAQKAGY